MTADAATTYRYAVPNQPRTPSRSVRVDDPEWEAAEAVTKRLNGDRSGEMKRFWDWYFYAPGVTLDRPPLAGMIHAVNEEIAAVEVDMKAATNVDVKRKLGKRLEALQEMRGKLNARASE